jgi:hypothetical protein
MGATETIAQVNFLADSFAARNTQMKALYKLLRMDDENEHEDMESFVGNDPSTYPTPFTVSTSTSGRVSF